MKFYNKTSESHLSHVDNTEYDKFIRKWKIIVLSGYFLISAALIFVGSLGIISQVSDKIKCTELVQGRVSDVIVSESISNSKNGRTRRSHNYYPVFTYNYNGMDYNYTAPQSTSSLKTGHKLDIYVYPDDPTRVYVPEYMTVWWNSIIEFLAGIAMAVGMIIHIKRVRDGARNYYASLNNTE